MLERNFHGKFHSKSGIGLGSLQIDGGFFVFVLNSIVWNICNTSSNKVFCFE